MFYSNNDHYMQDLYSYNQMPNNTYNPYMGNWAANVPTNTDGIGGVNNNMYMNMPNTNMGINQNPNMFAGNQNMNPNINVQNPNNLYPSIYRIVNPVVNRVVSGSNIPYLTEDNLNNMVDTVYNIIEGQVELEDDFEDSSRNTVNNRGTTTTTTTQNPNTNLNSRTVTTTDTRNTPNSNATNTNTNTNTNTTVSNTNQISNSRRNNRNNSLLRDLIKILILRQIFSRNQMVQMPCNYQNQFGMNQNFMQPGMYSSNF